MGAGAIGKVKHGAASTKGAPMKPSIPSVKSVKASGGKGQAGVKGGC